ncbi:hypothetical protein L2E82_43707 [Cichorium intybus]|uniref:Uncharacterized protein n=1 Tax=Cichorium intybus TaxID=13427 RepID=A0ACB8ZTG7_CICIN|nr:hypothetical protein L2E82_43707 [Cichorium intybus]
MVCWIANTTTVNAQGFIALVKILTGRVAVVKILNATLVIPHLEVNPVWQDSSSFTDIFDVDHFIKVLQNEVSIIKELPTKYSWSTREYYGTCIRPTRIKTTHVHASANWYLENVLPMLNRGHPPSTPLIPPTTNLQQKGKTGNGKFIVLHLRFDKDMAAHSACDFSGGKAEKLALAKYRQGRSPLTPEEIILLLRALGFNNHTRLYLASHKVYGGEARIRTLRKMFPLMEDKKSLASEKERAKVEGKASLLAVVDYYVTQDDVNKVNIPKKPSEETLRLERLGDEILMAAGDTFRAAPSDQLGIWAERTGCEIVLAEKEKAKASSGR